MFRSFKNITIRKKLTALMMLISVSVLLLVFGFYLAEEFHSTRIFLKREMTTLGATLGDSCKKLLLTRQIKATQEILASLSVQPNIRAAYLFDEVGTPVAQYLDPVASGFVLQAVAHDFPDPDELFWIELKQQKMTSSWEHFGLFLPIEHDGRQVGSIYLLSDLRDLYGRLSGVVFVVLLLLGPLLLFSWWLAGKLQRPVSEPLLSLATTMGTISQSRDFSLRAEKVSRDEIGLLVDGFNNMLEQIEANRHELVEHQQSLEQTVDDRTAELREIVQTLERAKQQVEAASEAKSQFLSNITHELRTPLIGVLGMNELLFRTALTEQQQMLAATVQKSGDDLLTLINNILDFSKIEVGKLQLEETEFSLYRVVDEVLDLLAGQAAEKGLSLYCQVPLEATCRVLGDEVRIRQVLMNLVGNAIKFTEQGSVTVKLDAEYSVSGNVSFDIEIIDTGIGMDDEVQQQIFAPFYQSDASHTRKYGGSGLGLAIVMQLVHLLNGCLRLDSSAGKGSCFKLGLTLPLHEKSVLQLPDNLIHQPVLVYSDDETCRQFMLTRLRELGLRAESSLNAADLWYQLGAAERAGKPFELAIFPAEAQLPDGKPLYRAIRDTQNFRTLRRIMLLNRSEAVDLHKPERSLYLPIGWDVLCETINQCWHELHLVGKSPPGNAGQVSAADFSLPKAKLMVAGGSVASRELIRLSLGKLPFAVDTAKDLSALELKIEQNHYLAVLLDTASVPPEQLQIYCSQRQPGIPLIILCSPTDELDMIANYAAGLLEKPFNRESFLQLLHPLLTDDLLDELKTVVDEEAGR